MSKYEKIMLAISVAQLALTVFNRFGITIVGQPLLHMVNYK